MSKTSKPVESHIPLELELQAGGAGPQQLAWHYAPLHGQWSPLPISSLIASENVLILVNCLNLVTLSVRIHLSKDIWRECAWQSRLEPILASCSPKIDAK